MERRAFELLYEAETSWWYRGRANVVRKVLSRFHTNKESMIADIGAGFGGMRSTLALLGTVDAFEPDGAARAACEGRGYRGVYDLGEDCMPRKNAYDLIALCDVLEHTPDDRKFLYAMKGGLREGGALLITVPAFPFLWSEHDVGHHHYRRYTKSVLVALLNECGFTVHYASYWNMLLFIPATLVRLTGRSGSSALAMPRLLDRLFYIMVAIESLLIPLLPLPFGTGLVVYATRSQEQ